MIERMKKSIGEKITNSPSNVANFLEGTLLMVARGKINVEYEVRDEMLNPANIIHGGIISTMIDDSIGMAVFTLGNEYFFTTINLQVDFFSYAKLGEKLIAKAFVLKEGKQVIHMECHIHNMDDRFVAKGNTTLIKTKNKIK